MTLGELVWTLGFDIDKQDVEQVKNSVIGLRDTANKLLGVIGLAVSITGIKNAINECVAFASEAEEMQNKFDVVFEGMTDTVETWARNYADAIGRNTNDIKTYLADMSNLLVGFMGQDQREAAAELAESMTKMALDLSSFNNIDENVAVHAMQNAVMGETESAKTLGAVLNDVTRAEAMATLGIKGKFEALDQATKMQVNYQAIVNQSKDAIDDCERSVNSYRSTLIAYQSTQKEIKTIIGQFFMPAGQKLIRMGTRGLLVIRDLVQGINNLADELGGADRILFVLGGTIFSTSMALAFLNFRTIATQLATSKLWTMLGNIGKAFISIKMSTIALASGFLLMTLIVEDFISFMQGRNSIFGTALEKAGIDCEMVREKFRAAWTGIKIIISTVGKGIWEVFSAIFGGIRDFAVKYGPTLLAPIGKGFAAVASFLSKLFGFTNENEMAINALEDLGNVIGVLVITMLGIGGAIKSFVGIIGAVKAFSEIVKGAQLAGKALILFKSPIFLVITAIAALIAIFAVLYRNWHTIKEKLAGLLGSFIATFENIRSSVGDRVAAIKDAIVNGITEAVMFITSLPAQAIQWGADIVNGIKDGIWGAIGGIAEAAAGIAGKISSFLHFSVPDEGPLSDFDTYMPDMIDLMTQGISAGKDKVNTALIELTAGMSARAKVSPDVSDPEISGQSKKAESSDKEAGLPDAETEGNGFFYKAGEFIGDAIDLFRVGKEKVTSALRAKEDESGSREDLGGISDFVNGAVGLVRTGKVKAAEALGVMTQASTPAPATNNPLVDFPSNEKGDTENTGILWKIAGVAGEITNLIGVGKAKVAEALSDLTGGAIAPDGNSEGGALDGVSDFLSAASTLFQTGKSKLREMVDAFKADFSTEPSPEKESDDPENDKDDPDNRKQGIGGDDKKDGGSAPWAGVMNLLNTASDLVVSSREKISGFVGSFGPELAAMASVRTVNPVTASSVTHTTSTRNISQSVEIHNQFHGDKAIQQKAAKAMDKSASDITAELARGLAYAR